MFNEMSPGLIGLLKAKILVLPQISKTVTDMADEYIAKREAGKTRINAAAAKRARRMEKRMGGLDAN